MKILQSVKVREADVKKTVKARNTSAPKLKNKYQLSNGPMAPGPRALARRAPLDPLSDPLPALPARAPGPGLRTGPMGPTALALCFCSLDWVVAVAAVVIVDVDVRARVMPRVPSQQLLEC